MGRQLKVKVKLKVNQISREWLGYYTTDKTSGLTIIVSYWYQLFLTTVAQRQHPQQVS